MKLGGPHGWPNANYFVKLGDGFSFSMCRNVTFTSGEVLLNNDLVGAATVWEAMEDCQLPFALLNVAMEQMYLKQQGADHAVLFMHRVRTGGRGVRVEGEAAGSCVELRAALLEGVRP